MKDTELYRTLQTLSPSEMRDFRRYIASPYLNNYPELGVYLDLIVNKKGILLKEASDEVLLKKARKTGAFKNKKDLYNYRSNILELLETYILQFKLIDPLANQLALAKYYRKHGLNVRYSRIMRGALKMLETSKIRDTNFLYNKYNWKKLQFEDPQTNIRRTDNREIEEVAWSFDEFYLSEKLVYATEMVNRQNMLKTRYEELIPAASLALNASEKNEGFVNLHIYIYKLFTTPSDFPTFLEFEKLYQQVSHTLTQDERSTLSLHAFNYCVKQLNIGMEQFNGAFLNLAERMEADGTLMNDHNVHPWVYKNLIHFFLRQNQLDRAERFWKTYSSLLPESHRESVSVLAQAQIALARKDYKQVFSITGQMRYIDQHLVVSLKVLATKAYLQLDEREQVESQLEAFTKYLKYHAPEINEERIKRLRRFITFCRRLNNLQFKDYEGMADLRQAINAKPAVAEAAWLVEFISNKIQQQRSRSRPGSAPAPKRKSR